MQLTDKSKRNELTDILTRWQNRRRVQRLVRWLPRALMIGCGVGIVATLALWVSTDITALTTFAGIVGVVVLLAMGGVLVAVGMVGDDARRAARHFEQQVGLQERISTALDLLDQRIAAAPELATLQIDDAVTRALSVDPQDELELTASGRDMTGAVVALLILIAALGAFAVFGNPAPDDAPSAAAQESIAQAAQDVRDISDDMATDTGLTADERDALLESIETRLDEIDQPDTRSEDAFVSMSQLESELRDQAASIRDEIQQQQDALERANESLSGDSSTSDAGSNSAERLQQQLGDIEQQLENLDDEERQQLADELQDAAEATGSNESLSPLSEELQNLSEQVRSGDNASEALQQAQDELEQVQQEQQQRQLTSQNVESAADRAQESAEDIAAAERESVQQENTDSSREGEDVQSDSSQESPQSADDGQSGQQNNQGAPSNSGAAQNQQSAGSQGGDQAQQAGAANTEGDASTSASENTAGSSVSDGAGEGESEGQENAQGGDPRGESANNPSGEGESREFEPVFSPQDLTDSSGSENVELEAGSNDAPGREGDFQQNPTGNASVPYDNVFQQYNDAANQALDNDYIPLGLRDVVRDYFTGLDPNNR